MKAPMIRMPGSTRLRTAVRLNAALTTSCVLLATSAQAIPAATALPDAAANNNVPSDTGKASSLAEEAAVPTPADASVSPGSFETPSGTTVRLFSDAPAAKFAGVNESRSRFTKAELARLSRALEGAAGQGISYGFYYDPRSDSIKVEGNIDESQLPAAVVSQGKVQLRKAKARRLSRYNDEAPHWGGSLINSPTKPCSTAFTVRTTSGDLAAVTAAHCGALSSKWKSGPHYYGTMTARAPYPAWDLALLSGSEYYGAVYMGNTSGTDKAVGGAGDPKEGAVYCTSGAVTGEVCGRKVIQLNGKFCDVRNACTTDLVVFQGGKVLAQGDSGSPLVVKAGNDKVHVRGVNIGVVGTTMYAEKWSMVVAAFGVSIVTGLSEP